MRAKLPVEINFFLTGLAFGLQGVKGITLLQHDLFVVGLGWLLFGLIGHDELSLSTVQV
jgi:uncharacterized membrane protein